MKNFILHQLGVCLSALVTIVCLLFFYCAPLRRSWHSPLHNQFFVSNEVPSPINPFLPEVDQIYFLPGMMCALIAWSSYWWHLETCSRLAASFFLPDKGNGRGNCFNQPVGNSQSFSCVLTWDIAFISTSVGLMHIQLVLQSLPLQNCFLVCFHHCCAIVGRKSFLI